MRSCSSQNCFQTRIESVGEGVAKVVSGCRGVVSFTRPLSHTYRIGCDQAQAHLTTRSSYEAIAYTLVSHSSAAAAVIDQTATSPNSAAGTSGSARYVAKNVNPSPPAAYGYT